MVETDKLTLTRKEKRLFWGYTKSLYVLVEGRFGSEKLEESGDLRVYWVKTDYSLFVSRPSPLQRSRLNERSKFLTYIRERGKGEGRGTGRRGEENRTLFVLDTWASLTERRSSVM